jgi:hypothetical protein
MTESRTDVTTSRAWALLVVPALAGAGCERLPSVDGPLHEVVVVAAPERWVEFERRTRRALEQRVSGVRDERVFALVHQEPYAEGWEERSRAPLLLVLGEPQDAWMEEALAKAGPAPGEPGPRRAPDVWAQGQVVNLLVLSEAPTDRELGRQLATVYAQLHADFRSMVRARLYAAGANTELADTLWEREGFGILVPDSYTLRRADSIFLFSPDSAAAVEQRIAVTWTSPAPSLELDEVLAWRARTAREHYGAPQQVGARVTAERLSRAGYVALEIRGQWTRPAESGERQEGSLLTRVAVCEGQNRAYLLDSWLHTPEPATYEYVVQLETILDTFRCE